MKAVFPIINPAGDLLDLAGWPADEPLTVGGRRRAPWRSFAPEDAVIDAAAWRDAERPHPDSDLGVDGDLSEGRSMSETLFASGLIWPIAAPNPDTDQGPRFPALIIRTIGLELEGQSVAGVRLELTGVVSEDQVGFEELDRRPRPPVERYAMPLIGEADPLGAAALLRDGLRGVVSNLSAGGRLQSWGFVAEGWEEVLQGYARRISVQIQAPEHGFARPA